MTGCRSCSAWSRAFDGRFETYAGLLHPDDADSVLGRVGGDVEKTRYVVEHRVVWPDGVRAGSRTPAG
jgi:hypothetical protein